MAKKIVLGVLISIFVSFIGVKEAKAALITVNPKGEIVWQVLGDESSPTIPKPPQIKVKSIAENVAIPNSEISLSNSNGKVQLNVTNAAGVAQNIDVTNLKENLIEIEARGNTNDLKIGESDGQFVIEENGVIAKTSFPITIDPIKNELAVKTNSGSRLISILPYEAVVALQRAKIMDRPGIDVSLGENSNGELQYSINGQKEVSLFNLATIKADIKSVVSASNGEIVKIDEPQWLKLFGFLFS